MILAAILANAADLALSWSFISTHGLAAEQNPFMAGAFGLGLLAAIAWKCAMLALVFAGASLNGRYERVLVGGVAAVGLLGAASALAVAL